MDWIPGFLKDLSISKSLAGAVFVTTLVLIVGPTYAPAYIDPVPSMLNWLVKGICVFTFCLLLFWAVPSGLGVLAAIPSLIQQNTCINRVTKDERDFVVMLGVASPSDHFNLEELDDGDVGKLKAIRLTESLVKKGLVTTAFDRDFVKLTQKGQKLALKYAGVK